MTKWTLPDMSQDDDDPECLTIAYMQGVADGRGDRWQPIETAPKDGAVLLFESEPLSGGSVCSGWIEADGTPISDVTGALCLPTHWMPLPAPPQEADT